MANKPGTMISAASTMPIACHGLSAKPNTDTLNQGMTQIPSSVYFAQLWCTNEGERTLLNVGFSWLHFTGLYSPSHGKWALEFMLSIVLLPKATRRDNKRSTLLDQYHITHLCDI